MNDDDRLLRDRLRAYESRVPDAPEPSVSFGGRPPWAAFAAIGAAAVLAGAVIAGNLANREVGDADPTSTPTPSATAEASPVPTATPAATPGAISSPAPTVTPPTEAPTLEPQAPISGVALEDRAVTVDGSLHRIAAEGTVFYALGGTEADAAAIWSSTDGSTWRRADLPFPAEWDPPGSARAYAHSLVSVGGRLVAIGTAVMSDYAEVVVWESTDGMAWQEIDTGSFRTAAFMIQDVTNGPAGLVAIDHHYGPGTGTAWRSGDGGHTWTEHRPPGEDVDVNTTVGTTRGYLIAGAVGETFSNEVSTSPRIWYSNDAMTWTPASLEGGDGIGEVEQLAIDGSGRWVAIGSLNGRIVAWRSTDRGLSWAVTADFGPVGESTRSGFRLASAPDGFIAVSTDDPAVTWTSADGVIWTAGAAQRPAGLPEGRTMLWASGIARIGDTLIVGGSAVGPEGQGDDQWLAWRGRIQR